MRLSDLFVEYRDVTMVSRINGKFHTRKGGTSTPFCPKDMCNVMVLEDQK